MLSERKAIIDCLVSLGVGKVSVEANGGGDSGQIESVSYCDKNGEDMTVDDSVMITFMQRRTERNWASKSTTTVFQERTQTLKNTIESLAYWDVQETGIDWYNNEGGSWSWNFNFIDSTFDFKVYVNEEKQTGSESWQKNISEWLADEEQRIATDKAKAMLLAGAESEEMVVV